MGVRQPRASASCTRAAAVGRVRAGSELGQVVAAAPRARGPQEGERKRRGSGARLDAAESPRPRAPEGLRSAAAVPRDPRGPEARPR